MKQSRSALRHIACGLVLGALLGPVARAATPEAQPVLALNAALIAAMKSGSAKADFAERTRALDPVIRSTFDLPVILKNSTGFYWATLPAAQQRQLLTLFEQFTVASYASNFDSYGGQKIVLLPQERSVGAKKIVETEIVPTDGSDPTRLDYVMAEGAQGWQVNDVLLNGTISNVAIQSSDFSSEVTSGDASQLIAALKSKIAALSGGASSN